MFTIGIYLAQTSAAAMFKKKVLYGVSAVRLILIPLVTLALLSLLPGRDAPAQAEQPEEALTTPRRRPAGRAMC